ncbi:MAG TPA: hypothetical protein DCR93_31690 [Cytophagales bacterium]|nr:hypothetical protein [Cytophagales bacterium]
MRTTLQDPAEFQAEQVSSGGYLFQREGTEHAPVADDRFGHYLVGGNLYIRQKASYKPPKSGATNVEAALLAYYKKIRAKLPAQVAAQNYFEYQKPGGGRTYFQYDARADKLVDIGNSFAYTKEEKDVNKAKVKQGYQADKEAVALVNAFKTKLNTLKDAQELEDLVVSTGVQLWDKFAQRIKGNAGRAGGALPLDGNLYWARLHMMRLLRAELPKNRNLLNHVKSQLPQYMQLLDQASRGMRDAQIGFPADRKVKRILIAGFDPFDKLRINDKARNISAQVALHFDGQTLGARKKQARIEAVIFPVSYEAFDRKQVEKFLAPYLDKVDAIVTFSQGEAKVIDIERFYANYRGGAGDNNAQSARGKIAPGKPAFYETNLPTKKMIPRLGWKNLGRTFGIGKRQFVYFDQSYLSTQGKENEPFAKRFPGHNFNRPYFPISKIKGSAIRGSGSNFFSNELPYRVANLIHTKNKQKDLTYGHIHLPHKEHLAKRTVKEVDVLLKRLIKTL